MTQINLANVITQIQPAGVKRAGESDTGRLADRLRNVEQRNQSSQGDSNTPNRHNIREDNRLEDNQDSQLQPGPGRLGEFSAPVSTPAPTPEKSQDSAKPKKPKLEINFEKVVAEIISDGTSGTSMPAGKLGQPGKLLKSQAVELKAEIPPTKPDIEAIPGGTKELPGTSKAQVGAVVAKNLARSAQVASVAVAVDKPQTTPTAKKAHVPVSADKPQTEVSQVAAGVGQAESGKIKLEASGLQAGIKANAADGIAVEAQAMQSVKNTNTETGRLAEPIAVVMKTTQPAQSRAGDIAFEIPAELAEGRSLAQAAAAKVGEPKGKAAQTAKLRAGRIAAYREVQQSGSGEVKPKSAPAPVSSAEKSDSGATSGQQVGKTPAPVVAAKPVQNELPVMRENSHIERSAAAGELPNADIAARVVQGEATDTSQNLNTVAELLQPSELTGTGIASVGSAGGVAAATAARAGSTEMIEQITAHIQASRDNLGEELTVRLDPPELGQVRIQLRSDGGGLRCVIRAEQARTLGELNREAPALLQRLNDAGIQVKNIEFQMDSQNQGRGNLPQNQAGAFGEFGANSHGRGSQAEGQGESRSFSDSPSQSQQSYDLTAEENNKHMPAGQYISEGSINVMI